MATLDSGDIRRQRASRYADRSWTCPCGRTVWGNGGKSSHKRACRTYKQNRLDGLVETLAEIDAGTRGKRLRPVMVERFRRQYEAEAERLRAELA